MRCCIVASLTFLAGEFWASTQTWQIRSVMQESPRILGIFCGLVTIIYSFVWFSRDKRLASIGLVIGLLAASLALLPSLAYN